MGVVCEAGLNWPQAFVIVGGSFAIVTFFLGIIYVVLRYTK